MVTIKFTVMDFLHPVFLEVNQANVMKLSIILVLIMLMNYRQVCQLYLTYLDVVLVSK